MRIFLNPRLFNATAQGVPLELCDGALAKNTVAYNNNVWAPYRKLDIEARESAKEGYKNDTRYGEF